MNWIILSAALVFLGAGSLHAAGVTWSYDGAVPYDAALVVRTDDEINDKNPDLDIAEKRRLVLTQLTNETAIVTLDALTRLCRQIGTSDGIEMSLIQPAQTTTRVRHLLPYFTKHQGWGFSLLVNLDSDDRITEFAINEVTTAIIQSELVAETELTIRDADLASGVSASALTRLRQAGAPFLAHHPSEAPLPTATPQPETRASGTFDTFVFDITNAVNGFTYHVVTASDPHAAFTRCDVSQRAARDGRLAFELPIPKDSTVTFYRVDVDDKLLLP